MADVIIPTPKLEVVVWCFDKQKWQARVEREGFQYTGTGHCAHNSEDCIHTRHQLAVIRLSPTYYFKRILIGNQIINGITNKPDQMTGKHSRYAEVTRVDHDGRIVYLISGSDAGLFLREIDGTETEGELTFTPYLEVDWDKLPPEVQASFEETTSAANRLRRAAPPG